MRAVLAGIVLGTTLVLCGCYYAPPPPPAAYAPGGYAYGPSYYYYPAPYYYPPVTGSVFIGGRFR